MSSYPLEKRSFPCKEFDDPHAPEEFLQEFRALIRPYHALLADCKETLHDHGLRWRGQDKKGKTSDGTGAEYDDEENEADNHLDGTSPSLRTNENSSTAASKKINIVPYGRSQHRSQYGRRRSRCG